MEKEHQPDSMATITMKPEYPPSEVYSASEPPPVSYFFYLFIMTIIIIFDTQSLYLESNKIIKKVIYNNVSKSFQYIRIFLFIL